jgi:hypothetical protein
LLERAMVGGATAGEREAAARALAPFPPADYKLRYAEWGVFLADGHGGVALTRAQLDEVPPFVRRIGNPIKELESRAYTPVQTGGNFKPVIHLTASVPIAVDLEAYVRWGRPWVAHPAFDDLVMLPAEQVEEEEEQEAGGTPTPQRPNLAALDPKGWAALADLGEGYPWISPAHRAYPWGAGSTVDATASVGVRWQSLIVSPTRLPWMSPAVVGADVRFAWWERLRAVPCSWVASRGESERFLYYDGPTTFRLGRRPAAMPADDGLLPPGEDRRDRKSMYVRVTADDVLGQWLDENQSEVDPDRLMSLGAYQNAAYQFKHEVMKRGLTEAEAAAMTACWEPAFFKTRGRRRLVFLTEQDYAEMCPARVWPRPTETARVGVLWTELGS